MTPGQVLDVERLAVPEGSAVELERVLLVADDGRVLVGTPLVPEAIVTATVVAEHQAPKVVGVKYKAKVRYRRKLGHRQVLTRLSIKDIRLPQPKAEEAPEPPAVEAPPAPRARRSRARRSAQEGANASAG